MKPTLTLLLNGRRRTVHGARKLSIVNYPLSITLLLFLMVGGKVFGQEKVLKEGYYCDSHNHYSRLYYVESNNVEFFLSNSEKLYKRGTFELTDSTMIITYNKVVSSKPSDKQQPRIDVIPIIYDSSVKIYRIDNFSLRDCNGKQSVKNLKKRVKKAVSFNLKIKD